MTIAELEKWPLLKRLPHAADCKSLSMGRGYCSCMPARIGEDRRYRRYRIAFRIFSVLIGIGFGVPVGLYLAWLLK